jgi:hypothetical protein
MSALVPKVAKLKAADWVDDIIIVPSLEEWQEAQCDQIRSRKDVDFELLCEFDLVCANDLDSVQLRLKDIARRMWEAASKKTNSKPATSKGSNLPKSNNRTNADPNHDDETRLPHTFDLGMMLPDGREKLSSFHVLDGKKQQFGQILRANEEAKLVEQELMNVDPNRIASNLNIIDVSWATYCIEQWEIYNFFIEAYCCNHIC